MSLLRLGTRSRATATATTVANSRRASSTSSSQQVLRRISSLQTQLTASSSSPSSSSSFPSPPNRVSPNYSIVRTMASTSIPKTMKGVTIAKTGGTDVLDYRTDVPVPQPKDGEVLIKNDYIGVNYIDTYFRTGLYPAPSLPYTLGREGAGTVVAVGGGETYGLKVGQRAVYLAPAAYAEYTAAAAMTTYALPDNVDNKTAAAALLQGLTAITLIREAHAVKKDDWILVHAAAGGMGLWLCQLLKATGAHTIGTASTPEKRQLAAKAGAEVTLEYPEKMSGGSDAFVKKIQDLTGGEGVAAVFDGVGKDTFDVSLACVRRLGSMISFGNASGSVDPFTISRLSAKNTRLMRTTLFNFITTRDEFSKYTKDLMEVIGAGKVDVAIHNVYDLKDVKQSHQDLEGRKTTGKLLLRESGSA